MDAREKQQYIEAENQAQPTVKLSYDKANDAVVIQQSNWIIGRQSFENFWHETELQKWR